MSDNLDELRKSITGELSRLQLYAKDHPYDVTASDESDIEHAANKIMQLFQSHLEEAERRAKAPLIKSYELKVEDLARETLQVSKLQKVINDIQTVLDTGHHSPGVFEKDCDRCQIAAILFQLTTPESKEEQ